MNGSDKSENVWVELNPMQYKYVAQCIAYGLNCFPPWPNRDDQISIYANMFNLSQNIYGNWENDTFDDDEDDDE